MNHNETLYFISKCLTISLVKKNKDIVENILNADKIDWDTFVKFSTSNCVLPAIYCNLKRVKFLKYVPTDLVTYMKYISDINRSRNKLIIKQAKEINNILLNNNIKPIFLKGTGNLLDGLYDDLAERMVGDIDFLVSKEDFNRTVSVLKKDNYNKTKNSVDHYQGYRHYSRLAKNKKIAAIEIHKDLITEKYRSEFNFKTTSKRIRNINDFSVLSWEDQLIMSISSNQINDYGFKLNRLPLRNVYDVFLLSQKVDSKNIISKLNLLKSPLNLFIAKCHLILGGLDFLRFEKSKETDLYLKDFINSHFGGDSIFKTFIKIKIINFKRRAKVVFKSIRNRENRIWLFKRIKKKLIFFKKF